MPIYLVRIAKSPFLKIEHYFDQRLKDLDISTVQNLFPLRVKCKFQFVDDKGSFPGIPFPQLAIFFQFDDVTSSTLSFAFNIHLPLIFTSMTFCLS